MNRLSWLRLPLLLASVVVLQHSPVGELQIDSVHPDLMMLFVCSVAVVGGREKGVLIGFLGGVLSDSFLVTPFGLSSLIYSVIGYLVGEMERLGSSRSKWLEILVVGGGSLLGQVLFTITFYLFALADPLRNHLPAEFVVVSLLNVILAPIMLPLVRYALVSEGPDRPVELRR